MWLNRVLMTRSVEDWSQKQKMAETQGEKPRERESNKSMGRSRNTNMNNDMTAKQAPKFWKGTPELKPASERRLLGDP
jgi:hypothetical protein